MYAPGAKPTSGAARASRWGSVVVVVMVVVAMLIGVAHRGHATSSEKTKGKQWTGRGRQ